MLGILCCTSRILCNRRTKCQHPLTSDFWLLSSQCRVQQITGDGADTLAKVVLEHTVLTDFCGGSLRQNAILSSIWCKGMSTLPFVLLLLSAPPDAFD